MNGHAGKNIYISNSIVATNYPKIALKNKTLENRLNSNVFRSHRKVPQTKIIKNKDGKNMFPNCVLLIILALCLVIIQTIR